MNYLNYLAFEGQDGSGKTTLSQSLATDWGATWEFEPDGSTELTKMFRTIALDEKFRPDLDGNFGREYIMLANRSISLKRVRKIVEGGGKVISDRSFVSGMVYAKSTCGIEFEDWWSIAYRAITTHPDRIIYVGVDKIKISKRDGDIYDHAPSEFHEKVKANFEEALVYVKSELRIPVLRFQNDFTLTKQENLKRLKDALYANT